MATSVFGTQCVRTDDILCKVTTWIWRIAPVICIAIGTFGNSINIAILLRKNLRSKPMFTLVFVAIADLVSLWTIPLVDHFKFGYGIVLDAMSYPLCLANMFVGFIFSAVSFWMVAIFTFGRMLFIALPHRSNKLLSGKSSMLTFFGVFVGMSILIAVPIGLLVNEKPQSSLGNQTTEIDLENSTSCLTFSNDTDSLTGVFLLIAMIMASLVPALIILIGNCVLVAKLCRRPNQSDADNAEIYLIFAISGLMLVTCLPYGIFYYTLQVIDGHKDLKAPVFGLVHAIVENLVTCNHALNFFIYLWKSSVFKAEFNKFVEEIKARMRRQE